MSWLTRMLGGPHKAYKFQHEGGQSHVVYARNREQADRRMRAFLSDLMFGPWAMWHYPAAVEREFQKCEIVDD